MIKNKKMKLFLVGLACMLGLIASDDAGYAGIPEPPIFIVGSLETPGGLPVTSGELRFDFTPTGGGTTVRVDAFVGAFTDDITFFALVPLERTPVEDPTKALEFGTDVTYEVTAFYNGAQINKSANNQAKLLQEPYSPDRAHLIGPLTVMVSPTGPQVSVSPDLLFGLVVQGASSEKQFEIYSVGTEAITGTARMDISDDFDTLEGGVPVNEVAVNLNAGETLQVTVRMQPTVSSTIIEDTFQVRTNGGDDDRTVSGSSIQGTIITNPDIDGDGDVDEDDLYLMMLSWYHSAPDIPTPATDLTQDNITNHPDLARLLKSIRK